MLALCRQPSNLRGLKTHVQVASQNLILENRPWRTMVQVPKQTFVSALEAALEALP